ncbi:MAG TPA: type I polyketide synthase, partial [Bacillota bacterium]|nr:type I polyketide synthase [Bacillota bacterium]
KTVLALKNRQIPPSLHYQSPNPKIDFDNSPFVVNTQLKDWCTDSYPLRAGVSSFGIGGTNAHVVLEEAPLLGAIHESPLTMATWQLLFVSAKTETALNQSAQNLVEYLTQNPQTPLADVAYTLTVGRTHFPYRRAVVCADIPGAIDLLSKQIESTPAVDEAHHLVFMFPGQGSQYPVMGSELFETQPVFRAALTRCEEILRPLLHLDLIKVLYADDPGNQQIYETALTQPVIFSIEYALAQLLISWGLKPQSMIGHSVGEYVAACLAGVFSLEDALSLVAWRGRLMQEMVSGAMLSIPLPEAEVIPLLNQDLSMAAVNGPSACVVSGPVPAIEALGEQLKTKAINTVRLPVSHAFHSAMMEPMLGRFEEKIRGIKLSAPQIPYLSNVTGTWISVNQATSWEYWVTHLRNTVRFSDGAAKLFEIGRATLIEVGGGRTLTGFIQEHPAYRPGEHLVLPAMRHPKEPGSDVYYLLTAIGKLWRHGILLDWEGFYAVRRGKRISLPTYPFERRRFWIDGNPLILQN